MEEEELRGVIEGIGAVPLDGPPTAMGVWRLMEMSSLEMPEGSGDVILRSLKLAAVVEHPRFDGLDATGRVYLSDHSGGGSSLIISLSQKVTLVSVDEAFEEIRGGR